MSRLGADSPSTSILGSAAALRAALQALPKQICCTHEPWAGAVQAPWEHWQLLSDNDTPVRFMAAISSGGADKHLCTIQQREGRTVSWGAGLESQTSFWDVSENTFFFSIIFYFISHSEVIFTSLIGLQPKKKKIFPQIESPVLQPAPLCSLIALKQRPCVVLSQGDMGR